jgi:hypothetical protein
LGGLMQQDGTHWQARTTPAHAGHPAAASVGAWVQPANGAAGAGSTARMGKR